MANGGALRYMDEHSNHTFYHILIAFEKIHGHFQSEAGLSFTYLKTAISTTMQQYGLTAILLLFTMGRRMAESHSLIQITGTFKALIVFPINIRI